MTSAQVVETSVTNNSSFQNYTHPDDHTIRTTDTPGFKPFTIIKTLEDAGNDVPAHLSKITSYGFRREEDFDKYDALNMAEQLATAAKLSWHEKASTYDTIACTLREKLPFTKKQFKAYFVALLADKEYAKVVEAVAKVDKSFKSSVPSTASGSTGAPAHAERTFVFRGMAGTSSVIPSRLVGSYQPTCITPLAS